jgi:hypothetical protein
MLKPFPSLLTKGEPGLTVFTGCPVVVKVRVAGVKPEALTVRLIVPGVVVD